VKAIKVIVIIVAVLIAIVILLVGAGVFFTNRYLQSPAFKDQVLKTAHEELGADVRIDELRASLFSGVALRGVIIGNPPGYSGNLITAEAFVLRYRLLPLLSRRVEIEQLSLDKPVITLARKNKGEWNYEKFGAKGGEAKTAAAALRPVARTESGAAIPLDILISKLAITQGTVSMVSEKGKPIVKLEGIEFSSSVSLMGNKLAGAGKAGISKINVSDALFVQNVATPVMLGSDQVKLVSLSGTVADGKISGDVTADIGGSLKYVVNLQVKDSDIAKFLQEAGKKPVLTGKASASVALQGTGGVPTIIGNGRAEIDNGKLMEIPLLNLLATLLQVDALRDLNFQECLLEFSISNNVMLTPVIRLTSPQVQITGKGSVFLDNYTLNHNLTIVFAKGALDRAPDPIRGLFTEQQDGSLTLDFKVTGPYDSPKTDLTKRIAQGVGQQLIEKGLRQLLK
jgi:uncharacterized protein involved in outer membrane biogenesis